MDDIIPNRSFEVPIIKVNVKSKKQEKEYHQYMIKLPKKLVKILNIDDNCIFNFELKQIEKGEQYPEIKLELIRNAKEKKKD